MSARAARSPWTMLRELVGAMNSVELALASQASGVPVSALVAFSENRQTLSALSLQRLGEHALIGRIFLKEETRQCQA